MRAQSFDGARQALREMRQAARSDAPFEVAIVDMMMPDMDGAALVAEIRNDRSLQDVVVILLTSAGKSEVAVPGVDVEMVKPVRPSQLFDMLLERMAERSSTATNTSEVEPRAPDAGRQPARVLVVEDNAANLKVAVRMVERLGYRADVAATGAEAVAMLRQADYDAVLMDCQMPEMDGYEATRRVRGNERARPAHAHHRDDCRSASRGPRALPGRRHGRLHLQAGEAARGGGGPRALARGF